MRTVDSILAALQPFDDSKRFSLEHVSYMAPKSWQCELVVSTGTDRVVLNGRGQTAAEATNEVFVKYEKLFKLDEVRKAFSPPSIEYHGPTDL